MATSSFPTGDVAILTGSGSRPAAIPHVASPPLKLTSFKVRNAQAWAALTVAGRFQWNNTSDSLNTTCSPST